MAYIIAEPCIGTKDTACVDVCPGEVQRLLAELKISTQHFRVSMVGASSIVEFGADLSKGKQETILARLHREGVTTEVVPVSPRE